MIFSKRMQKARPHSVFELSGEGFIVWCGSVAEGDDGLYYLYFSFWPKEKGHNAWVTHSKIGYAVSKSPLGPFAYGGIALSGAGGNAWDRDCVHNPAVLKVNGVYYLYYMGNYGDGSFWNHRNHQRVGVAYADKPEGPFRRLDAPVVDVSPGSHDALMTSNPTVCVGGDKRIYMMYKAVDDRGEMPKGGAVVCAMAIADHPLGPFRKEPHPILINPENPWSVEDPFVWYEGDRYYAIAKDFQGYFTKAGANSVALFESLDAKEWRPAEQPLAFRTELHWEDGTVQPLQNMERPQMWLDQAGKPRVLCCACSRMDDPERTESFNVQIAIGDAPDIGQPE